MQSNESQTTGCPHAAATQLDPYDAAALRDAYALYARMRRDEPISYSPRLGAWVVSRHSDICAVLRDTTRFSSADTFSGGAELTREALDLLATGLPQTRMPVNSDPPAHGRLRRIVGSALTARKVAALRPRMRELTAALIDGFAADGRVDIIARLAEPLPIQMILEVIGVPLADMAAIKRWSADWFELLFARVPPDEQIQRVESFLQFQRYCERLIAERMAAPRDDALSDMLRAGSEDESPLTMAELVSLIGGAFIAAGHETTTKMIGNALKVLLSAPERWGAVKADPSVIPRYLEEALRIDPTLTGMVRTTTEPVEIAGVSLPAGTRLYLLFASGNHDEAQFPDPGAFDPTRANAADHLAFGRGSHYCIGAQLARAQAQIAIELLAERLPGLRLAPDQDIQYASHIALRGPVALWLAWDVPAAAHRDS
ncbi:cytochrome P450 [Polyangium aurulentum]|uniref:cytochrome P450 n=1 Tax=Polyangium aurulentum TaxID=2567896 RepID=UPI00146D9B3C|nr:cytochrome P450 [Polyangium aurulentum]UQA56914.1 cytochrome P450 [Polyangium aurulentum]